MTTEARQLQFDMGIQRSMEAQPRNVAATGAPNASAAVPALRCDLCREPAGKKCAKA